jgi:hypothetical protein
MTSKETSNECANDSIDSINLTKNINKMTGKIYSNISPKLNILKYFIIAQLPKTITNVLLMYYSLFCFFPY